MLRIEIAGIAITYRNAAELNAKIRRELDEARGDRKLLQAECKDLLKKEKALARFLGGPVSAERSAQGGTDAN